MQEKGVAFKAGMPARLCAYAKTVGHFPTALKEFEWRNKSAPTPPTGVPRS